MGAALTIVITLSFSIFVIRTATVAFNLTGLSAGIASFQALSAFSGTGFTTSEAEQIVNYPVRRKIVVILMVVGNLGLVAIMSTVVVSFATVEKEATAILMHLLWIVVGLVILWFLTLSMQAEKVINRFVRHLLLKYTELGKLPFSRLLQVSDNWSVCEHRIAHGALRRKISLNEIKHRLDGGEIMAVRHASGKTVCNLQNEYIIESGDLLVIFADEQIQKQVFEKSWLDSDQDKRIKES